MSHECPKCGLTCYCGGDIEDVCYGELERYCFHCHRVEDEDVADEQIEWAIGDMYTPEAMKGMRECAEYIAKHKITPNLDFPEQ